jgi:glycosyltransferase involved in cell wall biosynthesis
MNVWLLHIGEDLPSDGGGRQFRYGYLAQALAARGHEVVRWAPTFRHTTKTQRHDDHYWEPVAPGYNVQYVHAPGYRRHVGFARLRTYRQLAVGFRRLAPTLAPPDVIVAAIPSLEWAEAAIEFGHRSGVPVVVDVRDPWPDVFLNAVHPSLQTPLRFALAGYFRQAQQICRAASGLTAVSQTYLDWALSLGRRKQAESDGVFPIGFEPPAQSSLTSAEEEALFASLGIDTRKTLCTFAGQFERSSDLWAVVEGARYLQVLGRDDLQIILCGSGRYEQGLRRRAQALSNVTFTGWLNGADLCTVMCRSAVGLATYAADATQTLPNKPFEYMACGMALVSSLPGELRELIAQQGCGINYDAGNGRAFADAVQSLVDDPAELAASRARARDLWQNRFQTGLIYPQMVDFLEQHAAVNAISLRRAA